LGKIIFELMNQRHHSVDQPIHNFMPSKKGFRYWPELNTLVQRCLASDPDTRPQLNEILWATADGLKKWEQNAMNVSGPDVPAAMLWEWKKEDFAMGERVPKRWRWEDKKRPGHDDSSSEDLDGPRDMWQVHSEDEFGDESYQPSTEEQVLERARRGRRHPDDPIVHVRPMSSDESDDDFGAENYRPSTSAHVTKEIEEARRRKKGLGLVDAPGTGPVAATIAAKHGLGASGVKRKSSGDGRGSSKRSR